MYKNRIETLIYRNLRLFKRLGDKFKSICGDVNGLLEFQIEKANCGFLRT